MNEALYRKLANHLDRLPGGFPPAGQAPTCFYWRNCSARVKRSWQCT